ncbi:hypothetical protein [Streptomyces sp. NPDC056160]|uniref:hypothetical protein n=1 Tax=Streptomyces sp. NPDC056160 TaxID=3345731 RepID=UPI0035E3311A
MSMKHRTASIAVLTATIGATIALGMGSASATSYVNIPRNMNAGKSCQNQANGNNDWWGYPRNGSGPYWFYCGGSNHTELWVRQPVGGYWG